MFSALASLPVAQAQTNKVSTNLFNVAFVARCVQTNNSGGLAERCISARHIVADCAAGHGITNLASLRLVYDQDADAINVVSITNGVTLCEVMSFGGGQSLSKADGSVIERLAFVFLPEDDTARGSFRGKQIIRKPKVPKWGQPRPNGFSLSGHFHYSTAATATGGAKIYDGTFATGARFVPLSPPEDGDDGGAGGDNGGGGTDPGPTVVNISIERVVGNQGGAMKIPPLPGLPVSR